MKRLMFWLLLHGLLLPATGFGLTFHDLQAGDVVLLSLNCYECRVIESETESLFSHSGVVVINEQQETKIAQSLGRVAMDKFSDFIKNKTPGTFVHVYRPKEFKKMSAHDYAKLSASMLDLFERHYKGAPFDSRYIWNNVNAKGEELLYCSEFIAKFLDNFLQKKTVLAPISYSKHYDYWLMYFKGNVPLNEPGNSPASFSRDDRFEFIGKF